MIKLKNRITNMDKAMENIEIKNSIKVTANCNKHSLYEVTRWIDENEKLVTVELMDSVSAFDKEAEISNKDIREVYNMLQNRMIHPKGSFDKSGRFFIEERDLIDVRSPSRAYPYSEMNAGRSLKFVKKIAKRYGVDTKEELITLFRG